MLRYSFAKKHVTILSLLLILAAFFVPSAGLMARGLRDGSNNDRAGVGGGLGLSCGPALRAVVIGGTATITVRVSTPPNDDLTVNLKSADTSIATVSATATILAGQTSATATVTGVALGATYVTASTDVEQARCSVYSGHPFSGMVDGLATTPLRINVGEINPTIAVSVRVNVDPLTTAVPVRVNVDPLAVTLPVKVMVMAP